MTFDQAATKLEFEKVRQRILRYARSEPGREAIHSISISPSLPEIQNELSTVTEMKRLLEGEGEFPLNEIFPIQSAVHKASIAGTVLSSRELLQIAATLRVGRELRSFLSSRSDKYPLLWQIVSSLHVHKVLEFNIEHAIDEAGAVRANASKELQSLRRFIAEKYDQLRRRLEAILKGVSDQGFSQEDIITTREGRMVIPVKAEHKNRVPGFIHSASASGATVFIEPTETLDLNNEITGLQFQEQREIQRILADLTRQVGEVRDELLHDLGIIARLDALHAKAKYSIEVLGVQPVITELGPIRMKNARHPILVATHGYTATVPLDLELGDAFHTLVISGPNAGGKSVAMKCVGLLTLMMQAGIHVPASDQTTLRVFKKIFVDIGDDQSIENDLSTFSSHLANLRDIAAASDGDSLVLIDEIGSGTDPTEGGAIAASVLESLTQRRSYTIATTHQGLLKVFAHESPGVENGAMEFDQATLRPTYRFRSGVPGSSFALEMANRLQLSEAILSRAREFLGHQQTRLESLISELESSTQQYRKDLQAILEKETRLNQLVKEYESKLADQAKQLRRMKQDALSEATAIVQKANSAIEQSIREIRESSAERHVVAKARDRISQVKREIEQSMEIPQEELQEVNEAIAVGTFVQLKGGTETGSVESLTSDKRMAFVAFGNVRMKVGVADLIPVVSKPSSPNKSAVAPVEYSVGQMQDIDLRGMTGDEAIPLVDKFIDNAILSGLHRIDIIHGKGTGALRKKVVDFLTKHPHVRSFRMGEWNEGGAGATVVELKD